MVQEVARKPFSARFARRSARESPVIFDGPLDARLQRNGWLRSSSLSPVQFSFQCVFAGEFKASDDLPYVVLVAGSQVGRDPTERRRTPHDTQRGAIQRRRSGAVLDAGSTVLFINAAILINRNID